MRRVRYSVAASLDGYFADVDGGFHWIPHDATVSDGVASASEAAASRSNWSAGNGP